MQKNNKLRKLVAQVLLLAMLLGEGIPFTALAEEASLNPGATQTRQAPLATDPEAGEPKGEGNGLEGEIQDETGGETDTEGELGGTASEPENQGENNQKDDREGIDNDLNNANYADETETTPQAEATPVPVAYALTIQYHLPEGAPASSQVETYRASITEGKNYSVETPFTKGYIAEQDAVSGIMPSQDLTLTVKYVAATDTPYAINYILQNEDGSYALFETVEGEGTTGEVIEVDANRYPGFKLQSASSPVISPKGDSVAEATFSRNQYTIHFATGNGTAMDALTLYHGQNVPSVDQTPVWEGYTFKGWDMELPSTMPMENLTVRAIWEALEGTILEEDAGEGEGEEAQDPNTGETDNGSEANANYTVNHRRQDQDGEYALIESSEQSGVAGELTKAEAIVYPGFTVARVSNARIAEDGSTVATIDYDRASFKLEFILGDGTCYASYQLKYEQAIPAIEDPETSGIGEFIGWATEIPATMPAEDLIIQANKQTTAYDGLVSAANEETPALQPVREALGSLDAGRSSGQPIASYYTVRFEYQGWWGGFDEHPDTNPQITVDSMVFAGEAIDIASLDSLIEDNKPAGNKHYPGVACWDYTLYGDVPLVTDTLNGEDPVMIVIRYPMIESASFGSEITAKFEYETLVAGVYVEDVYLHVDIGGGDFFNVGWPLSYYVKDEVKALMAANIKNPGIFEAGVADPSLDDYLTGDGLVPITVRYARKTRDVVLRCFIVDPDDGSQSYLEENMMNLGNHFVGSNVTMTYAEFLDLVPNALKNSDVYDHDAFASMSTPIEPGEGSAFIDMRFDLKSATYTVNFEYQNVDGTYTQEGSATSAPLGIGKALDLAWVNQVIDANIKDANIYLPGVWDQDPATLTVGPRDSTELTVRYARKTAYYRIDHVDTNGQRLVTSETGSARVGTIIPGVFQDIEGYSPVMDDQVVGNGKTIVLISESAPDANAQTTVNVITLTYLEDVVEEPPEEEEPPVVEPTPAPDDGGYVPVEEEPVVESTEAPVTMAELLPDPQTVRRTLYISDADVPLGTGIAGLTTGEAME